MLYVKVDTNGIPLEEAKTSDAVKAEFLAQGTILPSLFDMQPSNFGYREVPADVPMPDQVVGKNIVPDKPTKNADGTYSRTWKYVDIPGFEDRDLDAMAKQMRESRTRYLQKFADSISPLRWESWTEEQRTEVRTWYQNVLNMTNDPNWPKVAFPALPSPIKG